MYKLWRKLSIRPLSEVYGHEQFMRGHCRTCSGDHATSSYMLKRKNVAQDGQRRNKND